MTKDKTTVKHPQNNQTETFEVVHERLKDDIQTICYYEYTEIFWNYLTIKHQAEIKEKDAEITRQMLKVDTLLGAASKQFDTIKELTSKNDTNKKMLLSLKEANKDMRSFEDVLTIGFQKRKIAELEVIISKQI